MIQRWQQLAERERRVLIAGGALLLAVLLVTQVWLPLLAARDRARADAAMLAAELAELVPQVDAVLASRGTPASRPGSVAAEIDRKSREARLEGSLIGIDSLGEGRVRVRFKGVSFTALMIFVDGLRREAGIETRELSAERAGIGFVDATVVLEG